MIQIIKRASELFLYIFATFISIMIVLELTNMINYQINWFLLSFIWLMIYLILISFYTYKFKNKSE